MKSLTQKFLLILAIIFSVSFVTSLTTPSPVSAVDDGWTHWDWGDGTGGGGSGWWGGDSTDTIKSTKDFLSSGGSCRYMMGLTSWDCNVNIHDEESLKSGIWVIVSNIAVDISIIAAYLVIGYVIYGGYLYTFSGGDPSKVASGKKTLIRAFTGLAIVIAANVIFNAIRIALVGNTSAFVTDCTATKCVDPHDMIFNAINWVTAMAGVVSVIFIIYGGISYITSAGDPNKVQKARQMILYALIGLGIVALSFVITSFISSTIRNATAINNETTISKEVYEIIKTS